MSSTVTKDTRKRGLSETEHGSTTAKRFPVAELYKPTMVKINVSNSTIIGEDAEPDCEEFEAPRGLICSYSAYFHNVFRKDWIEARAGRSIIDDTHPWVFRVYIGWLYYQEIYYDDQRVEPTRLDESPPPALRHQRSASDDWTDSNPAGTSTNPISSTALSNDPSSSTTSSFSICPHPQPHHATARDNNNPLTWTFQELAELYVFGEKYDTRPFRMKIFNLIQEKILHYFILKRRGPDTGTISYLASNLPPDSGLLHLIAWCFCRRSARSLKKHREVFTQFPSSVLVTCMMQNQMAAEATQCRECNPKHGRHHHKDTHEYQDSVSPPEQSACRYHEHGERGEEAARCLGEWEVRMGKIKCMKEVMDEEEG